MLGADPLGFSAAFCLGETRHYFKQCDLFRSFHAIIEVQFGGLARLDRAMCNYRDNLGSLYLHLDLTLTLDKVLHKVIVSAYAHYIDLWPMNGACLGHRAILMQSMLKFAMHYSCYRCQQHYLITQRRRRGLLPSMPLPAIDLAALLTDKEENLKPEQMNVSHVSIMDLLGDPGNPLYAEPHSMAEHFDAMTAGACAIGELPGRTHCRDDDATARVYEDEAKQVRQKILRYLDMRVMDGDLVAPTCLRMPTLILPAGHFTVMYYDPAAQGQYASQFPTRGQGFMQPRGDIRTSIVPRNLCVLPADVQEVVDQYFHREELERRVDLDEEESMSTDAEATETVRRLQLDSPAAAVSLQVAVHEALASATAARPQEEEEEYYYDSDDSVLDIDEQYPELAERVVQWQAARRDATSVLPWRQPDFGQEQRLLSDKLPDLCETINQARGARAATQVPVQSVAPMQLPFTSVRPALPAPAAP